MRSRTGCLDRRNPQKLILDELEFYG